MSEADYFSRALKWTKKKGFDQVKANMEGFETPQKFIKQENEDAFVPDITGRKGGSKSYIEIAVKEDNIKRKISKWKLLDTMAKMKGGTLFLLTPRGHRAFAERIIERYRIDATLVHLPA